MWRILLSHFLCRDRRSLPLILPTFLQDTGSPRSSVCMLVLITLSVLSCIVDNGSLRLVSCQHWVNIESSGYIFYHVHFCDIGAAGSTFTLQHSGSLLMRIRGRERERERGVSCLYYWWKFAVNWHVHLTIFAAFFVSPVSLLKPSCSTWHAWWCQQTWVFSLAYRKKMNSW